MKSITLKTIPLFFAFFLAIIPFALSFSGSYDQSISLDGQEIAVFRVTAKDKMVRTEFLKGKETEVILKNKEGIFRYIPQQNVALKLPDVDEQANLLDDLDRYMDFLKENGAIQVSSEKLGEYDTDVYEFNDPISQNTARAWVWADQKFPVQIEIQAPEGLLTIRLSNIYLGNQIETKLFELPENTQIVDLQTMLSGQEGPV